MTQYPSYRGVWSRWREGQPRTWDGSWWQRDKQNWYHWQAGRKPTWQHWRGQAHAYAPNRQRWRQWRTHGWGAGGVKSPVHPSVTWYYTSGRGPLGPVNATPMGGWRRGGGRGYPQSQTIPAPPRAGTRWGGRGGGPVQWTHQSNCRVLPGSTPKGLRPAPVNIPARLAGAGLSPAPGWTLVTKQKRKVPHVQGVMERNTGNHTWSDHNPWNVLQRRHRATSPKRHQETTTHHMEDLGYVPRGALARGLVKQGKSPRAPPGPKSPQIVEEYYSRRTIAPGRTPCHCASRGTHPRKPWDSALAGYLHQDRELPSGTNAANGR